MRFKFCPDCGTKLIPREIGDEGLVPYCEECKKPLFDMSSVCIIALVVNDAGEAVVMRQNYISTQYGNIVSGYMKPGEVAEETAVREVEEELGLKVDRLEYVKTYWYDKKDMWMIGYIAHTNDREIRISGEVNSAAWYPAEEALTLVHPKGAISYDVIEEYLERRKQK